jgi:demethylmenaquinone methyltransferase/2-methoxy-6-polyprenyl-1,4-benzoquinol methylase
MDADLRRRMLAYYDERALEYEEAYTLGTGTASIADPSFFTAEAVLLAGVVRPFGRGALIDIACGTGFWLPHYVHACSRVTLFDQSAKMLGECRRKVDALKVADRCALVQGDFFDAPQAADAYDCALAGFFLSHLTEPQEAVFFRDLRRMLRPDGRSLILDSAWSRERSRVNAKVEHQARHLNDGTAFQIYKRYRDQADIARWSQTHGVTTHGEHFGDAFFAVSGRFVL